MDRKLIRLQLLQISFTMKRNELHDLTDDSTFIYTDIQTSSSAGTEEVEAPLQCMQFRLHPAVSSHAISLGVFVMAIIN